MPLLSLNGLKKQLKLKIPAQARTTTSVQRCRLLELPRELRNAIYEFALTEEDGLVKSHVFDEDYVREDRAGKFWVEKDGERKTDANQLKLVCRQLYAETAGLGLRFNTLVFRSECHLPTLGVLFDFVEHECSKAQLNRIRKVVIAGHSIVDIFYHRPGSGEQLDVLTSPNLKTYAQAYPQTEISVHINLPKSNAKLWAYIAGVMQHLHGRPIPGILPPVAAQRVLSFCATLQSQSPVDAFKFPDNVRLCFASCRWSAKVADDEDFQGLQLPDAWKKQFQE